MNPPFTGITLFISLIIIVVGFVKRQFLILYPIAESLVIKKKRIVSQGIASICIVLFSFAACGLLYSSFIHGAFADEQNNYTKASEYFTTCESTIKRTISDKKIILRLDDVQAYGWTDISIKLMEDAVKQGFPIVAGVIPNNIQTDPKLNHFFKAQHCNIEIAIHGFTHEVAGDFGDTEGDNGETTGEFELIGEHVARRKLEQAVSALALLPETTIATFIPPQNKISQSALAVMPEYGVSYVSSEGAGPYDYDASTWNYVTGEFVKSKDVIEKCDAVFASGDTLCVIMLHPQDFSLADQNLNQAHYREYLWLLGEIKRRDVSVVRFIDLPRP